MPVTKPFEPDAPAPLDGIRVLDLSRLVAGNMLSLQLADFGAEVVKIEEPKLGDPLRAWRVDGVSAYWKVYGRNKKSLALDLRQNRGKAILGDLAAQSDVLIENFRPGTLEEMGFAPAILHRRNPGLVVVRVSGWGQDGPYRDRPGFGTLVEGISTFAAKNGYPDRPPLLPPLALADMIAGLYGFGATLVALRARDANGGKGQAVDLPLLDPIHSILGPEALIWQLSQEVRPRTGSRSNTAGPRNIFRTKDNRWIAISASMQGMVDRLFRAIGRPDMSLDPRFRSNADRVRNADECEAPIAAFIADRSLDEAMAAFAAAEVTAAPVYDIDQFVADPHVREREILVDVPDAELGTIAMHNIVPRLSGTPGRLRRAAPSLGEHAPEILQRIGIDEAELEALRRDRIVGPAPAKSAKEAAQ